MSNRKRNVGYVKPAEPSFIARMKQQIGYQEGPNVDTKREMLEDATDEDFKDRDDEAPTVVVLHEGDLTAEEAQNELITADKNPGEEEKTTSGRIMFRKPVKRDASGEEVGSSSSTSSTDKDKNKHTKKKKDSKKHSTKLLSFQIEDDEEDDS